MQSANYKTEKHVRHPIRPEQISRYMDQDRCFIDTAAICDMLEENRDCDPARIQAILQKSLAIETLTPDETACLMNVRDPDTLARMEHTAGAVKKKVYDNRIVTFAPLYVSNLCVNNCAYCAFRRSNGDAQRTRLSLEQIKRETEVLAGKIGHKRLIVVYGEHPDSGAEYIASTLQTIAAVNVKTKMGSGRIRRCNVNAAPMSIEDLKILKSVGIGTFQVFQETYHRPTYETVHPQDTIKGDYLWRLYAMHRAMEAGCDDVGIGVLFGLYDWKFEVMALLYHAIELEKRFGVGPHTISFPRLEPADNTPFARNARYAVSDADFRKIVTVIRLSVPYTGMILTAREDADVRTQILPLGCTQTDASSRIGLGAYSRQLDAQEGNRQQFLLGDMRSLDTVVRELAEAGWITSFCTAGYRCSRTGHKIMEMLKCGKEGQFCKLNAVITFREWLDDFATEDTKAIGEKLIQKEIAEIREQIPEWYPALVKVYDRVKAGERDVYF